MQQHSTHYQTIDDFFETFSLGPARSRLSSCIVAAGSAKLWKGYSPADLLWFTDNFEQLIEAAYLLAEERDDNPQAILPEADSLWLLNNYHSYCGADAGSTPWDCFPRHLSKKEFLNPFKALKKVTRCQPLKEWKYSLKDVLFHALSPNSIHESDDGSSLLQVYLLLMKLLEAAHLVRVRAGRKIFH